MIRFAIASAALVCAAGVAQAADTVIPVNNLVTNCAGGGTRTTNGTYDATSGAVNFTITTSSCVDASGDTHNGTIGVTGTALATSAGSSIWNLDIVYNFNDSWSNANDSVSRVCTWTKNGTFNAGTDIFAGSIAKTNCTLTINQEKEPKGILEQVLKKATSTEN